MSFLDQLRALRTTRQSVWIQFIGAYRAGCLDLYLFFEGVDDLPYYQPYLRQRWGGRGNLHGFHCGGKDGVIALIPKIKPALDLEWRALFFIDKDIDDLCGCGPNSDTYLFVTEFYSIENYIVDPVSLSVIWTDLLRLPPLDPRLTEILSTYDAAYGSFVAAMKEVMAWIVHLRRSGHKVVLNDVSMDNIIARDSNGSCSLIAGWADHILAASNTPSIAYTTAITAAIVSELDACDPRNYIRGKFALWFFVGFTSRVVSTVTERVPGESNTSIRVQLSSKTAIDILSPRLSPPATLTAFLNRTLPQ